MNIEMTPTQADRFLREMETTGPQGGAGRWVGLMKGDFFGDATVTARIAGRLKSGQWRLDALAVKGTAAERRRIVRVTTCKYRARKRRR